MKKITITLATLVALAFSGCGGGGGDSSSSSSTSEVVKSDVNIALQSNGAIATATVNELDANNAIDGDETTTWGSISDSSLYVEFKDLDKVKSITIKKTDGKSLSVGSNPDITVGLSKDGVTYEMTQIGTLGAAGTIACFSQSFNSSKISCTLAQEYEAKFIEVKTHNGESFDFSEIEVISYK